MPANIYEPFDLGAFDPDLKGRTLNILRNPTRGFRRAFLMATGDAFMADVGLILGVAQDQVETLFDDLDDAVFIWLFVPIRGDDGAIILPQVYRLWDACAQERVKKFSAAPRSPSPIPAPAGGSS